MANIAIKLQNETFIFCKIVWQQLWGAVVDVTSAHLSMHCEKKTYKISPPLQTLL